MDGRSTRKLEESFVGDMIGQLYNQMHLIRLTTGIGIL